MVSFHIIKKSESNREIYEEEIDRIINEDRELLKIYHQEKGRVHARRYRRQLREIGVNKGCLRYWKD